MFYGIVPYKIERGKKQPLSYHCVSRAETRGECIRLAAFELQKGAYGHMTWKWCIDRISICSSPEEARRLYGVEIELEAQGEHSEPETREASSDPGGPLVGRGIPLG